MRVTFETDRERLNLCSPSLWGKHFLAEGRIGKASIPDLCKQRRET